MRNSIIKYFALDYIFYIGEKKRSYVRASLPTVLSICLLAVILRERFFNYELLTDWLAALPLILSAFFGFIYFRFYPVKYKELDEPQKWQYGQAPKNIGYELTRSQKIELRLINEKGTRYKQYWPLIINLSVVIATALYYLYT